MVLDRYEISRELLQKMTDTLGRLPYMQVAELLNQLAMEVQANETSSGETVTGSSLKSVG